MGALISTHNFERLKAHILPLSIAKDFPTARHEWLLFAIEISEEWDSCPCGHEIKEHCFIRNQLNQHTTHVGNVCINRFIGISTGNLFGGLKRIAKDASANANEDLIQHAYRLGYIFEGEHKFLMDTRLKRKLSTKQLAWKEKINRRIITQTVVQRRRTLEPAVAAAKVEGTLPKTPTHDPPSKCQGRKCHGAREDGREPHPCPYSSEILADDSPCNCCDTCARECADEI